MRQATRKLLGRQIGHIRVVDLVGEGGMGTVFVGFDDVLHRRVALKAIHPEFRFKPEIKARFLREARILSQLQHPNICMVHDFIEEDDHDFLVLELIEGIHLRRAVKEGLAGDEKLVIAAQLLEVLASVHAKGVIHRDLKPENVMVTADRQVKVLDFGLSRSVDEDGGYSKMPTLHDDAEAEGATDAVSLAVSNDSVYVKTALGTVIGTAGYMSPEQARGEPATAASDMYSLGLILQELFTGEPPFEPGLDRYALLQKASAGETREIMGLPPDLTRFLNRLKSLTPAVRPSSVDALDQMRSIIDKPRRRRRRLMAGSAVVLITLFAAGMTFQFLRAQREAHRAEREASAARQVTGFMIDLFEMNRTEEAQGETITAKEILDRGAARIQLELADQPLMRARMMTAIGAVYRNLSQGEVAVSLLEQALEIVDSADDVDPRIRADVYYNVARGYQATARYEEAETMYRRALDMYGEFDLPPGLKGDALASFAYMLMNLDRNDEAEPAIREALEIRERVYGRESPEVAKSLNQLANFLKLKRSEPDEAEGLYRRSIAILRRVYGAEHLEVTSPMVNLAALLAKEHRFEEAGTMYDEVLAIKLSHLPADDPSLALLYANLSGLRAAEGRLDEAERLIRQSIEITERHRGANHPSVAVSRVALAAILHDEGRLDEAETEYRRALGIAREVFGDAHSWVGWTTLNLGNVASDRGDLRRAEQLYERARENLEGALGPDNPRLASVFANLAGIALELGRPVDAEASIRRALELREGTYGPDDDRVIEYLNKLVEILRAQGRGDEADEVQLRIDAHTPRELAAP